VAPHVRRIELAGSRAAGTAGEWSDWDFVVETDDLDAVSEALPGVLAPLEPLVQQWDRLSPEWCWMLILRDPVKIDLIFPGEPHEPEPPWEPSADNLGAIDDHFWDWMLWLKGKEAAGKREQVGSELGKLFQHLLGPLGVARAPASVAEAVGSYQAARSQAERRFGVAVPREVEAVVAPALRG
jgi:predicted nucleotidyltransferase